MLVEIRKFIYHRLIDEEFGGRFGLFSDVPQVDGEVVSSGKGVRI